VNHKALLLIPDGMADRPCKDLGGQTPLDVAAHPTLDALCSQGRMGMAVTVPENLPPGSDVANLALLGYDPQKYYTGRGPLEAASKGIALGTDEVVFRCNLVSVKDGPSGGLIMHDYSAGHITTEEAAVLIRDLAAHPAFKKTRLFPGVSYRHLMVAKSGSDWKTVPPHDIMGQAIVKHAPSDHQWQEWFDVARKILASHPVNKSREKAGKEAANAIWIWGQGKSPHLPALQERFGIKAAMITAVDLLRGIAVFTGMDIVEVPGVTGYLDTNFAGKAEYALRALDNHDLVVVHIEAPDETGHSGKADLKLKAIELWDSEFLEPLLAGLNRRSDPWRILVSPDHATPLALRTHTHDLVPFLFADSRVKPGKPARFTESIAAQSDWRLTAHESFLPLLLGDQMPS